MSTKAYVSSGYRWRLGIIAVVCLGFAALCVKDGFYTYPAQAREYKMYRAFEEEFPKAETPDWNEQWEEYALIEGLPQDPTNIKKRSDFDIYTQFIMLAITAPVGLIYGYRGVTSGGWWVEADENGVRANGGKSATWDQIKNLDMTRWKKGIAYVEYEDQGTPSRILIDDWKFQKEPTHAIMETIEQHWGDSAHDHDEDVETAEEQA
ncbi:hypothetical protein [Mucisphaera calidilacus]|uniref:Uncharacterized protein n=1 Tax=Mucisphaera calidilacus TaxID=2527982 RepID=A0A518BUW5_9BACT|nr:hypothetical protein [Mucisphaera calidilacus]QDU70759.1 hypothetical protein Pan265_05940 [Mucisphaera calidilacus]